MTKTMEDRFEEKFPTREIEGRVNEDTWFGSPPSPKDVKSFIKSEIELAKKEEQERIVGIIKENQRLYLLSCCR